MDKITLLLVDDHAMVRQGLRLLLGTQADFEIVGEAADARSALELSRSLVPNIVLMDINLPGDSGIAATREIAQLGLATRVLGLSAHEDQAFLMEMLRAGAAGYVLKGATGDELIMAIRLVHLGGKYFSSGIASLLESAVANGLGTGVPGPGALSIRERDVLDLLCKGLTYQAIAARLGLSTHTVATHRANIMRKLGVDTREQLMMMALGHRNP